jgi:ribosomal protein L34
MKQIFLATALAFAAATAATSANAQGVGVQVGPIGAGVGVGPYWDDGYHHGYRPHYAYANECRVIRERIETPSGRTIIKSRRVCD